MYTLKSLPCSHCHAAKARHPGCYSQKTAESAIRRQLQQLTKEVEQLEELIARAAALCPKVIYPEDRDLMVVQEVSSFRFCMLLGPSRKAATV